MGEGVTLDVTLRDASMQNLMQVYLREGVPPLSTFPVVKDLGNLPALREGVPHCLPAHRAAAVRCVFSTQTDHFIMKYIVNTLQV
ncbi:unnamed protein product [Gadus morhua 'NCC']